MTGDPKCSICGRGYYPYADPFWDKRENGKCRDCQGITAKSNGRVYPAESDPRQRPPKEQWPCWAPTVCGKPASEMPFIPSYQERVVNGVWYCPTHLDRVELSAYRAVIDPKDSTASLAREFGPWVRTMTGAWMRDRPKRRRKR